MRAPRTRRRTRSSASSRATRGACSRTSSRSSVSGSGPSARRSASPTARSLRPRSATRTSRSRRTATRTATRPRSATPRSGSRRYSRWAHRRGPRASSASRSRRTTARPLSSSTPRRPGETSEEVGMSWRMKGEYLKNCSCVPGCPCDTHGYPGPNEFCEGVVGMNITEGDFEGTRLDGLKWAVLVHWPKALHDGDGTTEVYIDEAADDGQREALGTILSGEAGGPLFEILSEIVTTVHGPHFVPIEWEFDQEGRTARLAVADQFETESGPLVVPATEDEQRVA